jgi:hypothetical protein
MSENIDNKIPEWLEKKLMDLKIWHERNLAYKSPEQIEEICAGKGAIKTIDRILAMRCDDK